MCTWRLHNLCTSRAKSTSIMFLKKQQSCLVFLVQRKIVLQIQHIAQTQTDEYASLHVFVRPCFEIGRGGGGGGNGNDG